jgi:hypothetical protein
MAVTIWLIVLNCAERGLTDECISLGDNTSAIGWIFRSTRLPVDSPHYSSQLASSKVALLVTGSHQCLCSQHLKGSNFVTGGCLLPQTHAIAGKPVAFD